ncbi:MAG: hypothetical protein H0X24_08490 [Ktedonobacterales bacterium]|nr:hypothetical protein [Ktedonobacterales bacterium]
MIRESSIGAERGDADTQGSSRSPSGVFREVAKRNDTTSVPEWRYPYIAEVVRGIARAACVRA